MNVTVELSSLLISIIISDQYFLSLLFLVFLLEVLICNLLLASRLVILLIVHG